MVGASGRSADLRHVDQLVAESGARASLAVRLKPTLRLDAARRRRAILDDALLLFQSAINVDDVVLNAGLGLPSTQRPRGQLAPLPFIAAVDDAAINAASLACASTILSISLLQLQRVVLEG